MSFEKMVNISQTFVTYHSCGNGFYDGTRNIISKNRNCIRLTHYPFWRKPVDVRNKVETRGQLKSKPRVTRDYIKDTCITLVFFRKIILIQMKI